MPRNPGAGGDTRRPGLRVVARSGSATLYVRGTVRGQRVFESTGTADPERAEEWRAKREAELWRSGVYGRAASKTFAHAVVSYLESEARSDATKVLVRRLLDHFGTKPLAAIDQEALDVAYRKILHPGAKPASKLRLVLTPLRAILEHAAIRRWCARPAFERPRVGKARSPFLLPAEATALVRAASPHLRPLVVFLVGTGCRLSEALELDWRDVDLDGRRVTLWQKAKAGEDRRERLVDLLPVVLAVLATTPAKERAGRVFRPKRHNAHELGKAYRNTGRTSGGQIKTAWASACARAGLPGEWREWARPDRPGKVWRRFAPELTPHDLRHTWASWHYCVHRDLLRLRDDGGWETVSQVERYAKRVPDSYGDAIRAWWAGGASIIQEKVA